MKTFKVLRAVGWCVVGLAGLAALSLASLTLYLTPERLSDIVSRQAGRYLDADVAVHNMQFTIWSSFPHFRISADSIRVISHTLDNLPDTIAAALPVDRSFLGSTHSFRGSINLADLVAGRISLRDVTVDSLRVNLVAFNDSINNYNIIPDLSSMPDKVPYITANIIQLTNPQPLTYFNASASTTVDTRLKSAALHRHEDKADAYSLTVDGKADMTVGDLHLLRNFPFSLSGLVHLGFDPLRVRMTDYAVSLADVRGRLSLNAQLGGKVKVSSMSYSIASFHPLEVLRYLMPTLSTQLDAMSADVNVMVHARLTAPWHPSVQPLPSLAINVDIPSGTASYTVKGEGTYTLDDIAMQAQLVFDGNDPSATYVTVPSLRLQGNGLSADVSGRLDNITVSPYLQADIRCSTDLNVAGRLPILRPYNPGGMLTADTRLECNLDTFMVNPLSALHVDGGATVSNLHVRPAGMKGLTIKADSATLTFQTGPHSTLTDTAPPVHLDVRMRNVDVRTADTQSTLRDLKLALDLRHTAPYTLRRAAMKTYSDAAGLKGTRHTSLYIVPSLPVKVHDFLSNYAFKVSLQADGGKIVTCAVPGPNYLYTLDLKLDNERFDVRKLKLRAGDTGMGMNGTVSGLRDFLLSGRPVPLDINMNVALDTVNINRLALLYERSMVLAGDTTAGKPLAHSEPKGTDSVAVMIPRNINARIKATAKETVYTDLHLFDLKADVGIHDGIADVNPVNISAAFGEMAMKLHYATDNIQAMNVSASLGLDNINVVSFFQNFHTLLLMMPQMKNLSGYVSAGFEGKFDIFPDMCANVPSLQADITLRGRDLKVHQSDFIRRITRMLLIRTDNDLRIDDMDIRVTVHDNLLELYPFTFGIDSYRLSMAGLNNFQGRLYYHIGVEKSPLHIPFGINIVGRYGHPELRFGGPRFKVDEATDITSRIVTSETFNVVGEAKYYIHEFLRKAAQSAGGPETSATSESKVTNDND